MSSTSAAAGAMVILAVSLSFQAPDRAARWRDDLDALSHALKSGQYAFAKRNDVVAFDAEIASLQRDAGRLTDADITLRIMKLVAAAGDGHSHVFLPLFTPFRRLPVTFEWFADGLAVTSAAPEYVAALGLRVTRLGSQTPDQVLAAAAPYIAHENEFALRAESPGYLTTVELLQTIGVADAAGRMALTAVGPDGTLTTLTVGPGEPLKWLTVSMFDAHHVPQTTSRLHPDQRYYWFEYLRESRAMFVQYNRCQDDPSRAFRAFAWDALAEADRQPVERWIVDLRRNAGGRPSVMAPLLSALAARASRQPVFVLIGGATFSAAIENALELKRKAHATLVGEPTGGRPNIFANPKPITLPNSRLRVEYSTSFVRHVSGADPPAVEPDVRAATSLSDALAGRDRVLETALQLPGAENRPSGAKRRQSR